MSVSSYSEQDHPISQNNGSDFYCTEEELFESFMEIVNDPALKGMSETVEDGPSNNDVKVNASDNKSYEEGEFTNDENKEDSCKSNTNDAESGEHLEQEEPESKDNKNAVQALQLAENKTSDENSMLHQSNVNLQEHSAHEHDNRTNGNESKNDPNDLTDGEEPYSFAIEHPVELKYENTDSKVIEESLDNVDREVNSNSTPEHPVNTTDQASEGQTEDQTLLSNENNEKQMSISVEKNNEQILIVDLKPTDQSKAVQIDSNSSEQEMNGYELDEMKSTSVQPSTSQKESQLSTHENEAYLSLSTDQNELRLSDNQSELNVIENDIKEGIRKTNEVCEELNAIMQRLSQSSDELLGDNDSDCQTTEESNSSSLKIVANRVPGLSENNNNLKSTADIDANGETQTADESLATENGTSEECNIVSKPRESKRPNSLPKLVVTSEATSKTTSSLMGTSSSPSNSPLEISPTCHSIREDRTHSMSDSLESSEGSLSGDTKSVGPSPTEARGLINWEILNTAFENPDTDEDESVYEPSGNFGGFGLILEEELEDTLAVNDESRFRSVSQSSTISEMEFQEEYKKQHSIGSLERKIDGILCSGYLFKLGGTGIIPKNWRKRWCVLRHDRCLYYYKTARDKVPCGIVVLANYIISHSSEYNKRNCIKISKGGGRTYFFCSDSQTDMLRWMEALRKAADNAEEGTSFVIRKEIIHNVAIPALSIKKPDCHGYLTKQGGKSTRSWKRRYCVLKNGCLYYYREMADTTALGVAKLHGYTVEEVSPTERRNGFRCVPPHSGMRMFTFIADNEYDKKRWIPCFQESIRANTS